MGTAKIGPNGGHFPDFIHAAAAALLYARWLRAVSLAAPVALPSLLPATTALVLARDTLQVSRVNGRSGVEHRSAELALAG